MSKKKKEAIKRKQQKEVENQGKNRQKSNYDVINSEDEFDEDTQSLNESDDDEEGDETSAHLIKAFGSTFRSEFQAEIQEVEDQQGLSPRGRKQVRRLIKSTSTSTSANSSRPNTRSKSKGEVLEMHDQHITCSMKHVEHKEKFLVSCIYAKCKEQLRRPLWDRLLHFSNMDIPWCTIGDFNVITSTEEKYGGIPYNMNKSLDFISIIEASGLVDIGYSSQHYTWCNQRAAEARVWKRLDRAMVNDNWLELMPQTTITHLPSVGSDHCPLLMEMEVRLEHKIKYFKFLHCWTENENFLDTVKGCWQKKISGNPMWRLHQKMKLLASTLSTWSKKEYGNIFSNVVNFKEQVKAAKEDVIQQNTEENRTKLHLINAQYIKYLKLEASILKQKTQLQWFKEGDTNSKYFHSIMRGRRRKLFIHKICNAEDAWIQGDENIAKAACDYFQNMFSGHEDRIREEILNCIPRMVTEEHNQTLQQMPNLEGLTQVVFSMNPNSTAGPDGGIGVRKLEDICTSLQLKQWWIFEVNKPYGAVSRANILPKGSHRGQKLYTGQSLVWNFMMKNKGIVEAQIKWKINSGNSSFWWDDWLGEGTLASYCTHITSINTTTISQFLVGGTWNETMVRQWVPPILIPKILSFPIHYQEQIPDEAIWKLIVDGLFSCSSAWDLLDIKAPRASSTKAYGIDTFLSRFHS
ncbi:hypothetical protein H5410_015876 [Solanum commersonii]|uniref:Uncharacterized protein n=1 Tax=Solanum commersonii TaxID=4109 RepID=A0A9J5ZVP6_SOLCO|nr:hypothetical protein H5410_015876 [Solanum commersonii]